MGRSLQNTMVNLGIQSACDEALYQVTKMNVLFNVLYNDKFEFLRNAWESGVSGPPLSYRVLQSG